MKSKEIIEKEISAIEQDDRFQDEPALVSVNVPLALIQVHLEARRAALQWVVDDEPEPK